MSEVPLYRVGSRDAGNFVEREFSGESAGSSFLLPASLELSDTQVYESSTRNLPGTASHFCESTGCTGWLTGGRGAGAPFE
jgi:hypothetical protein